jgi:hypothetical protein
MAMDGITYERACRICQSLHKHIIGTDCKEEHFGK